jgi:hypothetical protein
MDDSQKSLDEETPEVSLGIVYAGVLEELRLRPLKKVAKVNLNVSVAVTTALGVSGRVAKHREALAKLPGFDLAKFDSVRRYARALAAAESRCSRHAASTKGDVSGIVGQLSETRERFLSDYAALANRKLLDPRIPKRLGGKRRFEDLGTDVLGLVMVFRGAWPQIEGRSGLTVAELDAAELLAEKCLEALALRNGPRRTAREQLRRRAEIYTLLIGAYEEMRRGISYLFWAERDKLVPSLFAGRCKGRRRRKQAAPATAPDAAA